MPEGQRPCREPWVHEGGEYLATLRMAKREAILFIICMASRTRDTAAQPWDGDE
jgi:hypothetical protein